MKLILKENSVASTITQLKSFKNFIYYMTMENSLFNYVLQKIADM